MNTLWKWEKKKKDFYFIMKDFAFVFMHVH